jgi:hypothetical protein
MVRQSTPYGAPITAFDKAVSIAILTPPTAWISVSAIFVKIHISVLLCRRSDARRKRWRRCARHQINFMALIASAFDVGLRLGVEHSQQQLAAKFATKNATVEFGWLLVMESFSSIQIIIKMHWC